MIPKVYKLQYFLYCSIHSLNQYYKLLIKRENRLNGLSEREEGGTAQRESDGSRPS